MTITLLIIVWFHFVADFIFQTDKIAKGKSTSNIVLATHVSIYSLLFFLLSWKYAVVNAILHFITDYITSRLTTYYWSKNNRRAFFITIGADQAVHLTCLILTLPLI